MRMRRNGTWNSTRPVRSPPMTNGDPNKTLHALTTDSQQGYAHTCNELTRGVSAVAIPILGPTGDTGTAWFDDVELIPEGLVRE